MKKYRNRILAFSVIIAVSTAALLSLSTPSHAVTAADDGKESQTTALVSSNDDISTTVVNGYATVTSSVSKIWSDLHWSSSVPSSKYYHQTFRYDQIATLKNGSRYVRLISRSNQVIGYLNVACTGRTSYARGIAIDGTAYATVTTNSGNIYSDFDWHVASKLSKYYHQTLKIKRTYYHSNGQVYYSMYTYTGHWVGYVNSNYVTKSVSGFVGAAISTNRYVTIVKKGLSIYANLAWKKSATTTSKIFTTYHVIREYHHGSGSIYYQLKDKNGVVKGYVNSAAVYQGSGQQGAAIGYLKSISLTGSCTIWKDFSWHKAAKQYSNLKGQQLKVKRYYHHLNGSIYYSVYTKSGSWIGYVNASGTKKYVASKQYTGAFWLKPSENKPYPNLNNYPNAYFSVSQEKQRVYIKAANGKTLYTMICSTGLGNNTPNGWYKIQAERGLAFSGANYWTSWLNHGQYLFHTVIVNHDRSYNVAAAKKLGHKASHGCIRLPVPDAIWIYKNAPVGMRVHIY
ncbi:L,D-transpeptidase [Lacticaseibacillus sharpeae]|uniref:L,D-transpeptidase n=1 Tax=Lacticaseibacillus sharpeae TaxID=1626 RepID=UPI001CDAF633|nr:L,D-transpeptidase [Lacticaseibacillus sharpeae]